MRLERRHGWFFVGVTAWMVLTWLMFAKNLHAAHAAGEDRPSGYWIAHTVLIVVNLLLAGCFAWFAVRTLRHRGD
ncbi:SCO4848 family membrane protein [Nocardioides acrostichi]|uniref:Uncharacterized protein n=1 Tax=Nocardioides acrostichi TaxID=2784339 RepID=A0A930UZ91_9ACTN|nr:hypothetical protein [Nocardioides acrostichi]MBF4161755.1 hypothetical protein [Nocardioides acrostichi]